jgi:hypothetical protein
MQGEGIVWLRRNDSEVTDAHLRRSKARIHRSVSVCAGDWEYADGSVRDMASFGSLLSRLA